MARPDGISRRRWLAVAIATLAGALTGRTRALAAAGDCTKPTPEQTAGPFYPEEHRPDEDLDLTVVKGRSGRATGDVVHVRGRVLDEACRPLEGALVEIWQANAGGRYDHERDAGNPRPLDPNFQGRGRIVTAADGKFAFKTIKPGSYPADGEGSWLRPPHIHFKVSLRGFHELTTQMYFKGETLNGLDRIRGALSPAERKVVTVDFRPAPGATPEARVGRFDITLRKVT